MNIDTEQKTVVFTQPEIELIYSFQSQLDDLINIANGNGGFIPNRHIPFYDSEINIAKVILGIK